MRTRGSRIRYTASLAAYSRGDRNPTVTQLYEVIYVSQRAPGVTDHVIIDDIVLPAGLKNRSLDISGCLWFSSDRFLQILEGPKAAVQDVYAKILRDDRHSEIRTLSSTYLSHRSFKRWGMRALTGDERQGIDELIAHYAPLSAQAQASPRNETPPTPEEESLLARARAFLVELAHVDPALEG